MIAEKIESLSLGSGLRFQLVEEYVDHEEKRKERKKQFGFKPKTRESQKLTMV